MSRVPPARWLADYRATSLRGDVVAGITLAAYAIPVSLAYAGLIGVVAIVLLMLGERLPIALGVVALSIVVAPAPALRRRAAASHFPHNSVMNSDRREGCPLCANSGFSPASATRA